MVLQRTRIEKALRQSESRYRALVDQAPFSIQIFDPEGRTLQANKAWERLWGVKVEQIEEHYNVLQDPQLEERGIADYVRKGFAGEAVRIPAIQYDPNETLPDLTVHEDARRWLSAVIYPLKELDGQVREVVLIHEDVTARRVAEQALRKSNERLDLALQAADMGYFDWTVSNGKTIRNRRHDEIFGYDELVPEWTYKKFLCHVVPEDRQFVASTLEKGIAQRGAWDLECRIKRADAAVRWIWIKGSFFDEDSEHESRCAGTVADITERKKTEEELRDTRSRLEAALQAGAIVTWTWDIENNPLYSDAALAQLFGLAASEAEGGLLGKYIKSIHPDDRPEVVAALKRAVEDDEEYEKDYRILQSDGSVRWVVARGRVEKDGMGRAARMPGVLVDITERKQLEGQLHVQLTQLAEANARRQTLLASLQQSERQLRMLADTIPQLAWMARTDGHIFWFNRRWYDYTGSTPDKMEGWSWKSVHHPDFLPKVIKRWKKSLASGEPFDMVFPIKGADGVFRPFLTRVNPLRGQDGRLLYWFGTNTDISEIKEMEDRLRDNDRRKDEFLATLAHELRNPLAPIRNSLQILKMPQVDAKTAQETRAMMERQVHHLVRLVDDLLDVSRVMRGKIRLRKKPVELATVVARAVEMAQPLIDLQSHDLVISLPDESLRVQADLVRISQVIANLLTNAAKYTEARGRIVLSARREENDVVLCVKDNGIGIASNMLPQVFDLFVQVDYATTRSQGGLGLGLTLVKNLVEMHGGSVEAHSDGLSRGSEFRLRLPLLSGEETGAEAGESEGQPQPRPTGHRVLVVDDNRDAAMTLATLLRLQGHDVRVVHDGPAALTAVPEFTPALILLDLGMPIMDGYEVARRLRSLPESRDIVVAALTGWGQQDDRRRTREAGFDHHLVKPVEPEVLEDLLAMLASEL